MLDIQTYLDGRHIFLAVLCRKIASNIKTILVMIIFVDSHNVCDGVCTVTARNLILITLGTKGLPRIKPLVISPLYIIPKLA